MNKKYYQILNIPETATQDEIKKSYRKLAKQYHPDVNPGANSEAKIKEINLAYEVLGDPIKRKQYDQFGTNPTQNPYQSTQQSGYYNSASDLFEELLRQQQRQSQYYSQYTRQYNRHVYQVNSGSLGRYIFIMFLLNFILRFLFSW